jgi:hypothetical protein
MAALDAFWCQDTRDMHATNEALMILLTKSVDAEAVKDYRLISLIHMVDKLISKLLANHLAEKIGSLVHGTQCAFIKGRSIHANFKFVHSSARLLHSRKKATVLFKADLSKAFDSVVWAFLMEILRHMGSSNAWLNWTAELLRSASTRVLLNGSPGQRICHAHRLRQGDPLSVEVPYFTSKTLVQFVRLWGFGRSSIDCPCMPTT